MRGLWVVVVRNYCSLFVLGRQEAGSYTLRNCVGEAGWLMRLAYWLLRYAAGGLVAFAMPRLLVAAGLPLDRWIVVAGAWLSIHVDRDVALWFAALVVGIVLYVGSVVFSTDHEWRPEIPPAIKDLWAKVEPLHLIILGLLIAASGVAWEYYRGSQLSPTQALRDVAFQTAIGDLAKAQRDLAVEREAKKQPANTSVAAPRKYTAYEIEQRLRAVDEIYDVVVAKLTPAFLEGRDLFNNLKAEVAQGTAAENIRKHYGTTEAAFGELRRVLQKYEYLPDIVEAATKNTFNGLEIMSSCDNLINEIQHLGKINQNNVEAYLDRDVVVQEAREASRKFEIYLSETKPRLQQRRAEYAAAEIHSNK